MSKASTIEEKRAELIIKYRELEKVKSEKVKREKEGDIITYWLRKGDDTYMMNILLGVRTIGIDYIRAIKALVDKEGAMGGIVVGVGKYTYSARHNAPKMGIELIPPSLPTFDVFEHDLVSHHVIVGEDERSELIKKYHAEPYQFPWIKATDPISIILGAKPGDVLKSIQKSETAGIYESYRYVVA
jgi:DNA-directed RNA polymerase subunit H (RpoH/RPB5)